MNTETYYKMIDAEMAYYITYGESDVLSDDERQQASDLVGEYNALGDHAVFSFDEENFDYDTREYKTVITVFNPN